MWTQTQANILVRPGQHNCIPEADIATYRYSYHIRDAYLTIMSLMLRCLAMNEYQLYLHVSTGDIIISDGITLRVDSDLNGESPQFTLTCISTGGPATTVTWTRDSGPVSGERMTVLNNRESAQYTHTLTVTGRLGGLYQCTVSNNKP